VGYRILYNAFLLRRLFDPKREEVREERRKLHNEGRQNLFSMPIMLGLSNRERKRKHEGNEKVYKNSSWNI
jgi:hypothetical protein